MAHARKIVRCIRVARSPKRVQKFGLDQTLEVPLKTRFK